MAHQSLYRKYRPATFDDIVGQQHIERTLRNAVGEGTTAHAYLFTGPRGTGKTTTARILAKALLCDRGPTSEPDGNCEQCIEIAEGRHPDVFELDAASRTGVDNVRDEIIGRVQFAPTRGRYKVYIIDEVHMLSTAAFNALLKTLEEPPSHVIFVMCTTHPHKVPDTIHSRCQRFDFHRIGVEDIADRLRYIGESEGFKVDRNAYNLIAKHADGGMRDAITTLEQLASFTGGEVTIDDVEGLLGEIDSAQLFNVAGLIARRDIAGCFRWIAETVETGTDLAEMVRELTGHCRDLFVVASVGDATGIVDRSAEELAQLQLQAAEFGGPDRLSHVLDLLSELATEMRWSSDPRLSLEVALTRMARPQGEMTLSALAERVEALERGLSVRPAASSAVSASTALADARGVATGSAGDDAPRGTRSGDEAGAAGAAAATKSVTESPTPSDEERPLEVASDEPVAPAPVHTVGSDGAMDRGAARRGWQAVVMEIKRAKPARSHAFAATEVDVDTDGQTLVVEFAREQEFSMKLAEAPEMRDLVRDSLFSVFGRAVPFRYQLGRGGVRPPETQAKTPKMEPLEPDYERPPDDAYADLVQTNDRVSASADAGSEPAVAHEPQSEADPGSAPTGGLEGFLQGMGAKIVEERPSEPQGEDTK